jgi:hypothetical protein
MWSILIGLLAFQPDRQPFSLSSHVISTLGCSTDREQHEQELKVRRVLLLFTACMTPLELSIA